MFDPITLDQLRTFVTVVDEGNFSAAARKLKRVQSAVSTAMQNLEQQLGVPIWDRSTKIAQLTGEGRAVLARAQRVLSEFDDLRRLTKDLHEGLEAYVSLCVDSLYPVEALVTLCAEFARTFESVELRVDTQTMSAVSDQVVRKVATLGVVSPVGLVAPLERVALAPIRMIPVVGTRHPLARHRGKISSRTLSDHVQIVLSERQETGVPDQAVLSQRTWRVYDLHTKHAMLRAGLGFGNLPEHVAREDIRRKKLIAIQPAAWGESEHTLYLSAIYRRDTTLGPAHRWLLSNLESQCVRVLASAPKHRARKRAS